MGTQGEGVFKKPKGKRKPWPPVWVGQGVWALRCGIISRGVQLGNEAKDGDGGCLNFGDWGRRR